MAERPAGCCVAFARLLASATSCRSTESKKQRMKEYIIENGINNITKKSPIGQKIPDIVIDDSWLKGEKSSKPDTVKNNTIGTIEAQLTKKWDSMIVESVFPHSRASQHTEESVYRLQTDHQFFNTHKPKRKYKIPKFIYHYTSWEKAEAIEVTGIIRALVPHGGMVSLPRGVYLTSLKPSKSRDCVKAIGFENSSQFQANVQVCFRFDCSKLTEVYKSHRSKAHEYIYPEDINIYTVNSCRINRNPETGYFTAEVDEDVSEDGSVLGDSDDNADDSVKDYILDNIADDIVQDIDGFGVNETDPEDNWTFQDLFPTDLSTACFLISQGSNFCIAPDTESDTCNYIDSDIQKVD